MASATSETWRIDRYARFVFDKDTWQQKDSSKASLVLALTNDGQLVITHGSTIMESHNLCLSGPFTRGLSRSDSLLIMQKFKEETRRFRVRFSEDGSVSGLEACQACVQKLSTYFPVKKSSDRSRDTKVQSNGADKNPGSLNPESARCQGVVACSLGTDALQDEVTLGSMVQRVLTPRELPRAYQECASRPDLLTPLVRLCLADPTFPAFVEQVEQVLVSISQDQ